MIKPLILGFERRQAGRTEKGITAFSLGWQEPQAHIDVVPVCNEELAQVERIAAWERR